MILNYTVNGHGVWGNDRRIMNELVLLNGLVCIAHKLLDNAEFHNMLSTIPRK